MGWYIFFFYIGAVLWLQSLLRRPNLGFGLALLGAILAGGLALAAGACYLKGYTPPRPRNDSDYGGFGVPLLCLVFIPAVSALAGFVLGLGFAVWRERWFPATSSPKPEPLDL